MILRYDVLFWMDVRHCRYSLYFLLPLYRNHYMNTYMSTYIWLVLLWWSAIFIVSAEQKVYIPTLYRVVEEYRYKLWKLIIHYNFSYRININILLSVYICELNSSIHHISKWSFIFIYSCYLYKYNATYHDRGRCKVRYYYDLNFWFTFYKQIE